MLVAIEGSSGSGKTTLIKRLVDYDPGKFVPFSGIFDAEILGADETRLEGNWRFGWFLAALETAEILSRSDRILLVDRFHLSEEYFSSEYRNGVFDRTLFRMIDELMEDRGSLLVFVEQQSEIPAEDPRQEQYLSQVFYESSSGKLTGSREFLFQVLKDITTCPL